MACKQYEVRTATDKLSRDEDDSSYWVLRVDVVERTDLQKEKVIFSFVPEPWMHISAKVRHPEEYQKVYFMPGGRRFVVVGIQTLQIWSFSSNGNNNNFNLVFFWSRPNVGTDLVPNGQTATDSERSDKESSPYLKKPRIEAVANLEKPDAQPSTDPEKPQSETSGNPSDSGKIKGAIETELVGEYYHYIHNLHIHLDEKTEEAEAHIRLKRRRGTDIVSIPSEHSRDIHIIFLHCAQSIHLLAAAYTFSVQESKKFPNNLEKPLTFIEHAEAIVRFTQGHINRLLLRKHLHPKLTELDMPIHTKSGQASAQAPKKPRAEASVQALEKAPAKAPEQKPEKTPEKATEQAKAPEQAEAPEQAKAPKRGINDPPPSPKRHPSMPQGSPVPPGKVLMVLECGPPTDQKSQVTPHGSPISSTSATEDPRKKGIISFVIDTVDTQKEKFLAQKDEDASSEDIFTVLTLLLDQNDLNDANHIFIEGLFTSTSHEWVPHPSVALNPIDRMIDIGNERLLAIMINYCINNAKTHHPGYLTPVIQCLSELSLWYPDIVSDLFRKASYIPAHNPAYVASNAIIANPNLSDWIHFLARFYTFGIFNRGLFGFTNSSDINNYKAPIFSIRSQLPFYSHTGLNVILDLILSRRVSYFTYRKNTGKSPPTVEDQERRIYVSPFQFKPINGRDGRRDGSYLALVAGRDLSDTPAVVATVQYKWFTIGLYFWSIRFMVLLLFFILVVIITAQQIRVSSPPSDHDPTADEISARYLPGWQPVFIVTIAVGFLLIIYELFQVKYSPGKYFRSPYNYVDLAACLFPVVGCFLFLQVSPGTIREDTGIDGGPSQIWIMGFGILLLYLNLLFELRIFKQLGVAVNIIFNISRRIKWFLLIFVVILVSFTHVLLYLLHTRRYRTCKDGSCDDIDYPSNYPTGFFKALLVTYFFMSGRYDPVDTSLDKGSVGFQLVMVIFYFFTAILLLNVLIALMNDAFDESKMEGEIAHWKLVCEVLIEVETQAIFKPIVDDYDPGYIYYCASDEEVKKFQSGSEISIFADSSRAAHKQTQGMIIESLSEVKDTNVRTKVEIKDFVEGTLKKEFADLREDLKRRRDHDDSMQVSAKLGETAGRRRGHDGLRQELAEPRALVEHPPGHNELKQELAELRGLVERPPSHDDLKQELAELRELVERPPGHDELKKELSALKGLVESLVLQLRSNNTAT
ncbi:MAG: hypothetical protein J3Q66DRAFT_325332 [Benniella sp.]|nr:MAG: hypothetical protein J3Q66DRAFT_325332 [Benniella sp.]